jgi:hypothetical protein
MIMPPMVMRICLRCWPYTGPHDEALERQAHAPATAMATSMAGSTATMLRHSSAEPVQSPMAPSTLVATKAPSAMNTPWPKLSTSIRPNTSVRPEAMMKMIMPMASPATVSVSQVLGEPTSGSESASSGTSARGFQSKSRVHARSCVASGTRRFRYSFDSCLRFTISARGIFRIS